MPRYRVHMRVEEIHAITIEAPDSYTAMDRASAEYSDNGLQNFEHTDTHGPQLAWEPVALPPVQGTEE